MESLDVIVARIHLLVVFLLFKLKQCNNNIITLSIIPLLLCKFVARH